MQMDIDNVVYASFWERFLASILDSIVQLCVIIPLAYMIFGNALTDPNFNGGVTGILIFYVLPALYVLLYWRYKSATLGKIWMGIMIIDAKTGAAPGMDKLVLRYIGYFACVITAFLGFLLILIDSKNRGLHDMIAGTLVVKTPAQQPTHFMNR